MGRHYALLKMSQLKNIEDPVQWLLTKYNSGESCNQIAQEFTSLGIIVTARGISYWIKKYGTLRTKKEAFNNAISSGRQIYKKKEGGFKRHGIRLKLRYEVLQKYKACTLCGSQEFLDVDHIIPVYKGGKNEIDNLTVLCRACNIGKFHSEYHR
jgi:hypothetical protein